MLKLDLEDGQVLLDQDVMAGLYKWFFGGGCQVEMTTIGLLVESLLDLKIGTCPGKRVCIPLAGQIIYDLERRVPAGFDDQTTWQKMPKQLPF